MAGSYPRDSVMLRSPIEAITGIWRFSREPGGFRRARSLPGHLLHLVISGSYRLRTDGREYAVKTGDVIYYHESEEVEWLGNDTDVAFYSVAFSAPGLPPLPLGRRVFVSTAAIRRSFERLYAASLQVGGVRALTAHAALLEIICSAGWPALSSGEDSQAASSWWDIEAQLKRRKLFRVSIDEMGAMSHRSRASVVRACRSATGASPQKRLQGIRMAQAEGLLRFSDLSITGIAEYLSYPRVHEFSREFAKYFGKPPTQIRAASSK